MLNGQICSLSFVSKMKVWVFPKDRFVEYGPEDESYCRLAGYGREEERMTTIKIPHAVITGIAGNQVTFKALPDYLSGESAWPK